MSDLALIAALFAIPVMAQVAALAAAEVFWS